MTKDQTTETIVEETTEETPVNPRIRELCEKAADKGGLITMYRLAGVWSELAGRRVREQQLYNYAAKGVIKNLTDKRATIDQAVEFLAKRVS